MDSGLIVPVQLESLEATERLQYERYKTLCKAFATKYGKDPEFVSRAPGRVNLIGEHIDYCGYSVLPMALTQDLSLAVGKNTTTTLRISNVDGNFSEFDGDISTFTIDSNKPAWYNYVLCGIKGVTESRELTNLTGLNIMVDGTVPQAAGLSSSSALVCSAGLATAHVFNCNLSRLKLADICMKCERYIGTQGGGMDQSISFLAQHGTAKLISFNPLQATSVALPSGSAFVVSNSLVRMKKADTAHFNTRVVECKLAAQILAAHNSLDRAAIKTLRDVQQLLDVDFDAMLKMVDSSLHDDPYTVEEVAGLLSMSVEDLKSKVLFKNTSEG
uniref:Galactokinase N-terminal domain-containing protein n=1 Tax=Ciona savignyi TaxID=51511 RepID=H2Y699_CIOSA